MSEDLELADAKRQRMLGLGEQEYKLWQHSPITAAYLQYLDDQVSVWRELAADLIERGQFRTHAAEEINNPDCVRGQIIALKTLRRLELADIQGFYGKDSSQQPDEIEAPQGTDDD